MVDRVVALIDKPWVTKERILQLSIVGSRAYGIHKPNSDWDVMAVVAPPPSIIIGLETWKPKQQITPAMDLRVHLPHEYLRLLGKGSPNHLETLFLPTLVRHPSLFGVAAARSAFISKETLDAITGNLRSVLYHFGKTDRAEIGSKRRLQVSAYGYDVSSTANALRWAWMGRALADDPDNLYVVLNDEDRDYLYRWKSGKVSKETAWKVLTEIQQELALLYPTLVEVLGRNDSELANDLLVQLHRRILSWPTNQ